MRILYLRFATRGDWRSLGLVVDKALRIDRVGTVSEPTGNEDADGVPELEPVDGYHVNLICTDDRDLSAVEPFVIEPDQPARMWAV